MIATLPGFRRRITARRHSPLTQGLVVDNFAGAGGASLGIEAALGRAVDIAINHSPRAVAAHEVNHPASRHLLSDVWEVDPIEVCAGRPVDLAWFSPDCKHFSKAKGARPVSKRVRGLAWVVIKWAKAVRPKVIILENVEEFQTWGPLVGDRPCPDRKGQTFRRWLTMLRNLGYAVEWRELRACDYGVPTTRRRLFLVARCDGLPIRWPKPTHADPRKAAALGLKPWRTVAECIDWDLPCPSIFTRKRPLAEATQRRIANGLRRYVLEAKQPFIVRTGHWSHRSGEGFGFRGQGVGEPLATVCATNDKAIVTPFVATLNHQGASFRGHGANEPVRTLTASRDAHALIAPLIVGIDHRGSGDSAAWCPKKPLTTVTSENRHALVSAFLAKHYGGIVGHEVGRPIGTVTARDHHAIVTSHLTQFRGSNQGKGDLLEPMPTLTAQGNHIAEVRALLSAYLGNERDGQAVTVDGVDYQIVDIGMRMLSPRELLRAQFGRFADEYVLVGTHEAQIAGIGNSVCPELAEAIVRSNLRSSTRGARGERRLVGAVAS